MLIGKHWLDAADGQGKRRLDDPEDFARPEMPAAADAKEREVASLRQSLACGKRVQAIFKAEAEKDEPAKKAIERIKPG